MSALLERRYRVLLRLLPAEHRATRGEELLGMLLDLDEGRARPSARQGLGVVGLALRLRLARPASLLVAAFLVAYSTAGLFMVYEIGSGASILAVDGRVLVGHWIAVLLIPHLLRLTVAVAWIAGARRAALATLTALVAYLIVNQGLDGVLQTDLVVLAVLAVAVRWRWPAARPRLVLLATIPPAMVLWVLVARHGRLEPGMLLSLIAAVAALGALTDLVTGRLTRGGDEPAPVD